MITNEDLLLCLGQGHDCKYEAVDRDGDVVAVYAGKTDFKIHDFRGATYFSSVEEAEKKGYTLRKVVPIEDFLNHESYHDHSYDRFSDGMFWR